MTDFDPRAYWNNRAPHWTPPTSRVEEKENLLGWLIEIRPRSILDVGSGEGDIYRFLNSNMALFAYTMCDFSDRMRDECFKKIGVLPHWWNGRNLPYDDGEFNFVLSFSVLLHVPPDMIDRVLTEHARVSSRYLFIAASDMKEMASAHCFPHDYLGLFKKHDLKVLRETRWLNTRHHWLLERSN